MIVDREMIVLLFVKMFRFNDVHYDGIDCLNLLHKIKLNISQKLPRTYFFNILVASMCYAKMTRERDGAIN